MKAFIFSALLGINNGKDLFWQNFLHCIQKTI